MTRLRKEPEPKKYLGRNGPGDQIVRNGCPRCGRIDGHNIGCDAQPQKPRFNPFYPGDNK